MGDDYPNALARSVVDPSSVTLEDVVVLQAALEARFVEFRSNAIMEEWANCAWCALGIAAVLRQDIRVFSRVGAHDMELQFDVSDGESSDSGLLIHFPFRPSEWWGNPYNPCGCILFFSAESEIDSWCKHHNIPRGEVISIATGIALANKWFGDYLEPTWTRKTPSQSRELFENLGLTGAFWS